MASLNAPALRIRDLVVRRGSAQVVNGVSIEVPPGGSLGIVGESGCGKSSILRAVAGIDTQWSGSIEVAGRAIGARRTLADRRAMQMVFQEPLGALIPTPTIDRASGFPTTADDPNSMTEYFKVEDLDRLRQQAAQRQQDQSNPYDIF